MTVLTERMVWRREKYNGRKCADTLTAEQRENTRTALRYLQLQLGSMRALAQAMGINYEGLRHAVCRNRSPGVGMAFRAARVAGVHVEDVTEGRYPSKPGTCPVCGR
jgi:hypothetical protein